PRARCAAADADLGLDARRRTQLHRDGLVARDVSRALHHADRPRCQPPRRLAPRHARPAVESVKLPPLLSVEGLATHFATSQGLRRAVDRVSFTIDTGEVLGLVGESGCGKSVTSLSIMRLVPRPGRIAGGRVLFRRQDLLAKDPESMRRVRGAEIAM